jgi:porin
MAAFELYSLRYISSVLALCCAVSQPVCAGEDPAPALAGTEAQGSHAGFGGPASVGGQIQSDTEAKAPVVRLDETPAALQSFRDFKERVQSDYGLTFGIDYNLLYQHASKSPGEQNAASGALRLFGSWQLLDQESGHPGSIVFKVENRHRLGTDIAPQALGGEVGYAGLTAVPFSDAGSLLTNLYWLQSLNDDRFAYIVGIVDVTDYVGVYGLVNPWADFMNLAFSTDPTIPAPDQGFGAAARWRLAEHYYVLAGLADANGDPGDPWNSVDAFFDDAEAFKHIEMGWYGTWESRIENNVHLTFWQVDERTEAGIADGWGAAFSYSRKFDERWLPFLRVGYGDGGGALLERSVSAGVGRYTADGQGVLGLGLNWGRPNRELFGADARDQYTVEAYYRLQLAEHLTITPDVQLIKDPALNPGDDSVWVAGLRARFAF